MVRSHLRRHLRQQSSKNIFLALGGIIVILVLLVMFGMDFLINFSLFVRKTTSGTEQKNSVSYIAPPVLNPLYEATKSATITVSGYAGEKQTIKLFVNGKLTDKTKVNKENQFVFPDVELDSGENEIKTKAANEDNKESDYSTAVKVIYIEKPPSLEISNPTDGQTVSKGDGLTVRGKTDPGVKVTINDFWTVTDDDGSFSHTLPLRDGDNSVKIVATDAAGNTTTKEMTVKTN